MAVNVGDEITAAQYNGLQSRVDTILGTGSGTNGYGQSLSSSQVSVSKIVEAADFDNLRTDINKCKQHQANVNANIGNIQVGQIIGADRSETARGSGTYNNNEGFNDYDAAISDIESNKFDIAESSVEAKLTSTRTTAWNGVITHIFTVTFSNSNQRRFFFNSGGEIRFSASLSGGSGSKSSDWSSMLSAMGTIKFGYTNTTSTGSGSGSSTGNYDLTGSYKTIFTKNGSGVYAENQYQLDARADSSSVLRFRVRFEDNDLGDQQLPGTNPGIDGVIVPGPAVDENVNGTITSTIQQLRATGTNVAVTSPSYSTTSNL